MRLAGYVTVTLTTFHKQSNGRRTTVESKSNRTCNHRITALDLRSTGRRFDSWPPRFAGQPWANCPRTCASVTKQYNLIPANERWRSTTGTAIVGLALHWRRVAVVYSPTGS